jgi:L-ascorbate metabolism protein UlaG (beta-lactamase superfamily)
VLIELGGVRLLTDPVLRSRVLHLRREGPVPRRPEAIGAVLLSHLHYDHLDLPSLRSLSPPPALLAPRGAGRFLNKAGFADVRELAPGETADVRGVPLRATEADHPCQRRPRGPRAQPLGFVVGDQQPVYFAGDTDLFPGMSELAPLQVALLPVAGWGPKLGAGHLDPERAARAVELLRPRVAVPIHWGTLYPGWSRRGAWFTDPPRRFAAHVAELAPDTEVRVLSPGEWLQP